MNANDKDHRAILESIAYRAMLERGLLPDFSAEELAELDRIQASTATSSEPNVKTMKERISVIIVCRAVCVPDTPKGQGGVQVSLASRA